MPVTVPVPALRRGRRAFRPLILIAAAAIAGSLAACDYAVPPAQATPADFTGLAESLSRYGITIDNVRAGEAGCPDQDLARTAKRFSARGVDQSTAVTVYLYMFRDKATFTRLTSAVDACARTYLTDPTGYVSIDVSPFVAAGQGPWGTSFTKALGRGLAEAAGNGG